MVVTIKDKASIQVVWKVNSYDYSIEKSRNIAQKFANKYGVGVEKIKVIPDIQSVNSEGREISVTDDIIMNINDVKFQHQLFKEYIDLNKIEGVDFDELVKIDNDINSRINYDAYDKFRRYSLNWIDFSNFFSYGKNNHFDFTSLDGLVLLNGEPANQSGKTTFAIEALRFALFGKTNKEGTIDKIFNKHLQEETTCKVECGLTIDGENYVIRRTITRPELKKRTAKSKTSQKVEYFKLIDGEYAELSDAIVSKNEENTQQTNKVIKEAIGKEEDFDLIISITGSNLDDLINKKDTDRGKLLSRWIGLLPLEEKDVYARERFNKTIKPNLLGNKYNIETLKSEISTYETQIGVLNNEITKYQGEIVDLEASIKERESMRSGLLMEKQNISQELMSIDINTLNNKMSSLVQIGKDINTQLESIEHRLSELNGVTFNINEYDALQNEITALKIEKTTLENSYKTNGQMMTTLEKSEYCPTCNRKYDNVDNSQRIAELKAENESIIVKGKEVAFKLSQKERLLEEQKNNRLLFDERSKLEVRKGALIAERETMRNEYTSSQNLLNEYNKNNEAIDKNNQIDIKLSSIDAYLNSERTHINTNIRLIATNSSTIENYKMQISNRESYIKMLEDEAVMLKNWKVYLDLVGKNGISKMVLRNALPIINAKLADLMSDVCDFNVEVVINDNNEVEFCIIKDGVKSHMSSGSGYERTTSALALRAVLANVSSIPRCNFIVLDELWGAVAKENLDKIKGFVEKILKDYDFIIQVSHLDEVKDWHKHIITVKKDKNVSYLQRQV